MGSCPRCRGGFGCGWLVTGSRQRPVRPRPRMPPPSRLCVRRHARRAACSAAAIVGEDYICWFHWVVGLQAAPRRSRWRRRVGQARRCRRQLFPAGRRLLGAVCLCPPTAAASPPAGGRARGRPPLITFAANLWRCDDITLFACGLQAARRGTRRAAFSARCARPAPLRAPARPQAVGPARAPPIIHIPFLTFF